MNQPENQSYRATAGDVEWLVRVVSSGRTGEIRNFPVAVARRILNSLRAPAAEPYGWYVWRMADGTGSFVFRKPQESPGTHVVTPPYAAPPAPVVQQQPRAWECVGPLGSDLRCATTIRAHADELRADGWTVTPLYALQGSP